MDRAHMGLYHPSRGDMHTDAERWRGIPNRKASLFKVKTGLDRVHARPISRLASLLFPELIVTFQLFVGWPSLRGATDISLEPSLLVSALQCSQSLPVTTNSRRELLGTQGKQVGKRAVAIHDIISLPFGLRDSNIVVNETRRLPLAMTNSKLP